MTCWAKVNSDCLFSVTVHQHLTESSLTSSSISESRILAYLTCSNNTSAESALCSAYRSQAQVSEDSE